MMWNRILLDSKIGPNFLVQQSASKFCDRKLSAVSIGDTKTSKAAKLTLRKQHPLSASILR
jgi:hypothetical protein